MLNFLPEPFWLTLLSHNDNDDDVPVLVTLTHFMWKQNLALFDVQYAFWHYNDFCTVWHLTRSQHGHQNFELTHVRISASNLDWKQVRGCTTKICGNFDGAPCSDSVVVLWFSGKNVE